MGFECGRIRGGQFDQAPAQQRGQHALAVGGIATEARERQAGVERRGEVGEGECGLLVAAGVGAEQHGRFAAVGFPGCLGCVVLRQP